jgi:hypothetical protein
MVKLEVVEDEHFAEGQVGPDENEDDFYSDTGSSP